MPIHRLPVTPDGCIADVLIGLKGQVTSILVTAGQPIPAPVPASAILDTGSDITCVAAGVLRQLGLSPVRQGHTHTTAGTVPVNLFEVSLSVVDPTAILFTTPKLIVMELHTPPPGFDVLIGRDLLGGWLLILDGPGKHCTLAF